MTFPTNLTSQARPTSPLSDREFLYYSRQLLLPDWSEQRQLQLKQMKVLVLGVGGLGCPVATALAGAGIGWLLLADGDQIELSNLPRQTLFRVADIGQKKANVAARELCQLNPFIRVDALTERLADNELERRVAWADLVIDCSDNIDTKLALNQLCQQQQKIWLGASVSAYQGYRWLINPAKGGCLICIGHQAGLGLGGCLVQGVFGPLVAELAAQLASSALRLLLQPGCPASALVVYQHQQHQFSRCLIAADPSCACCSTTGSTAASTAMPSQHQKAKPSANSPDISSAMSPKEVQHAE